MIRYATWKRLGDALDTCDALIYEYERIREQAQPDEDMRNTQELLLEAWAARNAIHTISRYRKAVAA